MRNNGKREVKNGPFYYGIRLLFSLTLLEILLILVPIPPSFEAGVWHGNSYRDQVWLRSKRDHNRQGYRDKDRVQSSLHPRLVVLGDSRFYGQYVERKDTFSSIVERKTSWEVLNFGLPGASIYEADDFLIQDALEYGPQKAVLCYDINSSLYSIMTRAQGGSRSNHFLNFARSSLVFRWGELLFYSTFQGSRPVMSIEEYESLLTKSIRRMQFAGVEVFLVIGWAGLPDFPELYSKERYEKFKERSRSVAHALGISSLETEKMMQTQDVEKMFVGMEQMHFSVKGHQIFADELMTTLSLQGDDAQ